MYKGCLCSLQCSWSWQKEIIFNGEMVWPKTALLLRVYYMSANFCNLFRTMRQKPFPTIRGVEIFRGSCFRQGRPLCSYIEWRRRTLQSRMSWGTPLPSEIDSFKDSYNYVLRSMRPPGYKKNPYQVHYHQVSTSRLPRMQKKTHLYSLDSSGGGVVDIALQPNSLWQHDNTLNQFYCGGSLLYDVIKTYVGMCRGWLPFCFRFEQADTVTDWAHLPCVIYLLSSSFCFLTVVLDVALAVVSYSRH